MPHWMKSADHGVMPLYDMGEVERHKKLGWVYVNTGESIAADAPPAPASTAAPSVQSMLDPEPAARITDVLDQNAPEIIALLDGMTVSALEGLRVREREGRARKGLLRAIDEAIEQAKG